MKTDSKVIPQAEFELDLIAGELVNMRNLLNIFANWFDETHKIESREEARTRTSEEIARMWDKAPMYASIITALLASITGLEEEIDAILKEITEEDAR